MKKLFKFLVLILIPLLLCSCWDYNDINKRGVVLSVGIDYNSSTDNYVFSGEVANFSPSSVQQTEQIKKNNIYIFLAQGHTFEDAKIYTDNSVPLPVFLGASTVVIFGKSLATKSIEPYLHRIDGILDYRKTLLAVVSKEPPEELLKLTTNKSISVGSLIQNNLQHLESSGKALYTTIGEMLSSISLGNVGYVLPYVGIQANDIRYLGLAIMKDSKLIHTIDVKDTDGLLYLLADNPMLVETIPGFKDPNNIFSFNTKVKKRKISAEYIDNTPIINVNLELNSQLNYQYYVEPISEREIIQLENLLSKKIKTDIQTIITKSQKEFQCDIFNFIKYFRADCPKASKSIDWEKAYPAAKVNVNVSTKIINLNLDDPNAKIKTLEGKKNDKS
jgi:spore germination protein KC